MKYVATLNVNENTVRVTLTVNGSTVRVSLSHLHTAVHDGALPCLRVGVLGPHRVHLDVGPAGV